MNQYTSSLVQEFISIFSESPEEIIIADALSGSVKTKKNFLSEIYFLANGFQENGMLPGDTVVIMTPDVLLYVISIFATLLSGGRIVIIDPEMGRENIQKKLKVLKPKFCFIDGMIIDGMKIAGISQFFHPIFRNISLEDLDDIPVIFVSGRSFFRSKNHIRTNTFKKGDTIPRILLFDENSDAIIVFTGGTTDEPKGVIHSHRSLFESIKMISPILGDEQVFYADLPHFLLFGLMLRKKVIAGRDSIKSRKLREIFIQHAVQSAFFAPYKIQELIMNNIVLPECLTHLLLGSAPIYRSFLEKILYAKIVSIDTRISCVYGMTEVLPIAIIDGKTKMKYNEGPGDNLGTILPGIEYKILDNELFIKAAHTMKTYLGKTPVEYIPTGDLIDMQWDSLHMIGRKKDMIIRGNYNIYPSLYEGTILSIPGIRECALFGAKMEDYDEKIILLVDGMITKDDLYRKLHKGKFSIDNFAMPDDIIFGKIPKYGRQKKINKTLLQKLYLKGTLGK